MSDPAPDVVAPWLEREIARALAPYAGKVTAEELEWMKTRLRESVTSGAAKGFARGATPHEVASSGEIAHGDVAAAPTKEPKRGAGGG